ncbi:haloacid dehalogenase [Capsulimonas corticalis]|uniref:Haloacid dehalogenase n=1 Tax=Capsulimonas corticalis TaxID=2219043 RepID=A0A402D3G9_9BACT|nr:HAD family hydrolase [Capsulimonas corticalis]BDI28562.1 haloacid dehalogenase [Capsulimonas corticalis]
MIKMVFFDIGDVLFDEDQQHRWFFHTLLATLRKHGKDVLWDEWNATRIALATAGPNPAKAMRGAVTAYCVDEEESRRIWKEAEEQYHQMRAPRKYGLLLDGVTPALQDLRRDFRLGVVANQHSEVLESFSDYGIAGLFDVIVISEMVGLFKPDPAIFQYGLDQAGVSASEAIFVGDRADNDVAPAKALGMKTIRFHRGVHYGLYNPDDPAQTADITIFDVSELAGAVRRLAVER